MGTKDIESAKRIKNKNWSPALKEYYGPEDVLRYFKERDIEEHQASYLLNLEERKNFKIYPPEHFFKQEVLEQGLILLKSKRLGELKNELNYIKKIKIPELEKEVLKLK